MTKDMELQSPLEDEHEELFVLAPKGSVWSVLIKHGIENEYISDHVMDRLLSDCMKCAKGDGVPAIVFGDNGWKWAKVMMESDTQDT